MKKRKEKRKTQRRIFQILIDLSNEQKKIISATGNLLIVGGPGSGKTTIAILKAGEIITNNLTLSQKIIFLSFARPSVARIVEALDETKALSKEEKKHIIVDTYHAFFWRLIRTHGYLLGLPKKISLLTPAEEAIALASIRNDYPNDSTITDEEKQEKARRELEERERLSYEDGKVCFELFADIAGKILQGSSKIRKLISNAYPYIILDEFQDTNTSQWDVVKALGENSEIIALADPEQRIYEFMGADPERINHYIQGFQPCQFDLSDDNFRSIGTQILQFANDMLKESYSQKEYDGITITAFNANQNQAFATLKGHVFQARKRLIDSGKSDWSLAILVPTKKMTRAVSDYLRAKQDAMTSIEHSANIDIEAVVLAAEIISFLLQPKAAKGDFGRFVQLVCNFYEGKGGDTPTKGNLEESEKIKAAFVKARKKRSEGKKIDKGSIIQKMISTYRSVRTIELTGDPDKDWRAIRNQLENGVCKQLKVVAEEARNLRLLDRGTQLRAALAETWRDSKCYENALEIVRRSFVQEHFANAWKPESGVVVMNMHKAKGKQFDEVIIFEGWPRYKSRRIISNPGRIVIGNSSSQNLEQAKQNFRVSITRAKSHTTILTPIVDPCILLPQ